MEEIYLDNQTATPPSAQSLATFQKALALYGSLTSPHKKGQSMLPLCKDAYESIYATFGANKEDTFVFTASGAEAINHVIMGIYLDVARKTGKNHFVTTKIEDAPIVLTMSRLQEDLGCFFSMADPDENGVVTAQSIAEVLTPRTALVSLSWGSGLSGVIHSIEEITSLCHERGILIHLDATHAIGKLPINFDELKVDFLTFNGSQLFAPYGTGGLFFRKAQRLSPFVLGGSDQGGFRGGALNIPGLLSLAASLSELKSEQDNYGIEVAYLRDLFEESLEKLVDGAEALFKSSSRFPHISCIAFPKVSGEALAFYLNEKGIYASFGGGASQQIEHLLTSCGVPEKKAATALSFGFSHQISEEKVRRAAQLIGDVYHHLLQFSKDLIF